MPLKLLQHKKTFKNVHQNSSMCKCSFQSLYPYASIDTKVCLSVTQTWPNERRNHKPIPHFSSFNGHFPNGSGLACTRTSPFRILLELRMIEVVVTTGAIRREKTPVMSSPPTNQHPVSFTGRMRFRAGIVQFWL